MTFEDNRFPQELHDFLHRMGIYSIAGMNGAEMAFAWTVNLLCEIPISDITKQLSEWHSKMHKQGNGELGQ